MDQRESPEARVEDRDLFHPDEAVVVGGEGGAASIAPTAAAQLPEHEFYAEAEPDAHTRKSKHPLAVNWTASEYITHNKSTSWYAALAVAMVVIAAGTWLVTRDLFPTTTVAIALLLLGIYAGHKPRQQTYALDDRGLTIGSRHYTFGDFRSFAVVREGAFSNIELMPLKRFAMYVAVYFDPRDEDKIVRLLSTHLPMEEPRANFADHLMRQIKF